MNRKMFIRINNNNCKINKGYMIMDIKLVEQWMNLHKLFKNNNLYIKKFQ